MNEPQHNSAIASAIELHLHSSLHLIKHQKVIVDKEPVDEMTIDKTAQFQRSVKKYIFFN
jgi:hypothetical protein